LIYRKEVEKMEEIILNEKVIFENIRHVNEMSEEFWSARELSVVLEYTDWRNFLKVIKRAEEACFKSNLIVTDHFVEVNKMVELGSGSKRKVKDYSLSRYACYLIVQNADPTKRVVALGQTYFAVQTRKQELLELNEDEKRLVIRKQTKNKNLLLNNAAKEAGVKHFDKFTNAGYRGLYNGETANDIAKRKGLRYREDILDNMGSLELSANLFRITLTEEKLRNENIKGEVPASEAHFEVGSLVRKTIIEAGGTVPEKLPVPEKSIKELEKDDLKKINGGGLYILGII